jgi:hypothetical protein
MKLHGIETELFEHGEFALEINGLTGVGAVGVRTGMNIPGADRKLEARHESSSSDKSIENIDRCSVLLYAFMIPCRSPAVSYEFAANYSTSLRSFLTVTFLRYKMAGKEAFLYAA